MMHTEEQIKQRPVLLILGDIPVGSEIGIDCKIWKIAEKFKGIAAIPIAICDIIFLLSGRNFDSPGIFVKNEYIPCGTLNISSPKSIIVIKA